MTAIKVGDFVRCVRGYPQAGLNTGEGYKVSVICRDVDTYREKSASGFILEVEGAVYPYVWDFARFETMDGIPLAFDARSMKTELILISGKRVEANIIPVPRCTKCGCDILACNSHDNSKAMRKYRIAQKREKQLTPASK
jgi:hypothetical protein